MRVVVAAGGMTTLGLGFGGGGRVWEEGGGGRRGRRT